jgi:hypothetical protein
MRDRATIPLRLTADLRQNESITFAYPEGTEDSDWIGGHFSAVAGQEPLTSPADFLLLFGDDVITLMWKRLWAAPQGTMLRVVMRSYAPPISVVESVSLYRFGVTGDGTATDGARIRTAIETAATDHLELVIPPPPQFEGWRLDETSTLTGKDNFKLTGTGSGIALSKRAGSFNFADWTTCSNFVIDQIGLDARLGEAGWILRGCTDATIRRANTLNGRVYRLYDGTRNMLFDRVTLDTPTAAIQFGEGSAGMIEGQADVSDITVRDCVVLGSKGEAFEWQNSVRRLRFIRPRCYDCNIVQAEEVFDIGGPAEDIFLVDPLIDNTGAFSSYTSLAFRGIFIKRANGINPVNVWIWRPRIYMASADADSKAISADDPSGLHIRGGDINSDVQRSLNCGGGNSGWVTIGDGLRLAGARGHSIYAAGTVRVTGVSRVLLEPAVGGAQTLAINTASINLAA